MARNRVTNTPIAVDGRSRVVIENVRPEVDNGRYPIKRTVGETVTVEADVFVDGHDKIVSLLLYRREEQREWVEVPMTPLGNDRWRAAFRVTETGRYRYTVIAMVDHFQSWCHDLTRRPDTDPDLKMVFLTGVELVKKSAANISGKDAERLNALARTLGGNATVTEKRLVAMNDETTELMAKHAERRFVTHYDRELMLEVDRERARFSTWYEFFPRSCTGDKHGGFRDCEGRLRYAASMGFDVVYRPTWAPIPLMGLVDLLG